MTYVTVVAGAQYGSEGKGAVAAYLTCGWTARDLAIRVAGPNAGHTVVDRQDRAWKLRQVPVAAVSSDWAQLHIAAGSEIDPVVLLDEIAQLDLAGFKVSQRLTIHPSATVILGGDIGSEQASGIVDRIGSTGKGIGAARAGRLMRTQPLACELDSLEPYLAEGGPLDLHGVDRVLVEGTQGYGLGLHTEQYPFVTSSDCRAIDFLAMSGISPWAHHIDLSVMLVARINAIRVAGNSGPLEGETTWAELGLPEERTTVTNKVRRVGGFQTELVKEAIDANGGPPVVELALTMVDHRYPEVADRTALFGAAGVMVSELEDTLGCDIALVGTGPCTMVDRR